MSRKVKEMIGGCCVCSDERGWSENPLVYCDGAGCSVAVHQACYGIVQVPTGPWFCRKCESQERVARVKCELCPQRAGALKRTDSGGWCHVVCALYIPEAWFANVQTMEPIVLNAVPQERFNKICYICEEQKRDTKATAGACMQCNRNSCKQYFHVTCAQAQGLLCEVTGSYENVKYCGYCSHHYKKLKSHSNVKTIPAFKPIPSENGTPDYSPEKNNPVKTEEDVKPPLPPAIEEVKSPAVDQSVSSTSDSVPPPLIPSTKVDSVSQGSSQVADISSAVSPSAEDFKSPLSGNSDHNQEPSSTGVVVSHAPTLVKLVQEGGATSSTENCEVDVGDASMEPSAGPSLSLKDKASLVTQTKPKRHRSVTEKSNKALLKKTKSGMTLSHKKDINKKMRKRRESGGTGSKTVITPVSVASSNASMLPGHHDYCGSIFGAPPYFQSLSAPGRVSLPSFSTHAPLFPSYPYTVDGLVYDSDSYNYMESSSLLNGLTNPLIQPPKQFPSLNSASPRSNHDHSQDFPLSMEQLLEQQWEQGAHFLMEQGQHFDISSLLNCLHRLKGENQCLEDQVRDLKSRRDHLMAVNARLSLPLSLYDPSPTHSKSPSVGSLEDISSPDDVQAPKLGSTILTSVKIPSNQDLMVEDILSPVETDHPSLSSSRLKSTSEVSTSNYSFHDQVCPPQPLMYSVVNPPPPTLQAISTCVSSSSTSPISTSLLLPPGSLAAAASSAPPQIPNMSSLSLSNHVSQVQDTT